MTTEQPTVIPILVPIQVSLAPPSDELNLHALFPSPTLEQQSKSRSSLPGPTTESGQELARLLKDNHERFHVFFNDKQFHNHIDHHLYALYALGARPSLLKAAYVTHADMQRPAFDSPNEITEENWKDHLEDEKYYRSYAKFFGQRVLVIGIENTLESYVFSVGANWEVGKEDAKQPQMVNKLLSGFLHPLIHAGHGVEFGTPGMIAEGLAMAAVTIQDSQGFLPKSLFVPEPLGTLSRLVSSLQLTSKSRDKGEHSFTILAKMLNDPLLAPEAACVVPPTPTDSDPLEGKNKWIHNFSKVGDIIHRYASMWVVDETQEGEVDAKVEELAWLVTLIYGVGGWKDGKPFRPNFFTMHLVTSSLFLASYIPYLKPASQILLLRSFFASALAVWVSQGRPILPISSFCTSTQERPEPPTSESAPTPKPSKHALDAEHTSPSPWLPILQTTMMHPDEHLIKLQRALAHYAAVYAPEVGKDKPKFGGTELEGAAGLDGSLFVRVAGVTMDAMGWVREGEEKKDWDFRVFLE